MSKSWSRFQIVMGDIVNYCGGWMLGDVLMLGETQFRRGASGILSTYGRNKCESLGADQFLLRTICYVNVNTTRIYDLPLPGDSQYCVP